MHFKLIVTSDTLDNELAGEDAHYVTVTKRRRVPVPERLHQPVSLVPAVQIPHPGSSYNPDFTQYQVGIVDIIRLLYPDVNFF